MWTLKCCILTSDPSKHAIPKKAEVAYSISVGELGWQYGKRLKSHGTFTNWCTGREWPVNCKTVISAWWRSNMPFQRRRKCIFQWPDMGIYWVGVNCYITECTGNTICLETRCGRESKHPAEGALGPPDWVWGLEELEKLCCRETVPSRELGPLAPCWAAQENRKETRLWPIQSGSICCSSVRSPIPSHTQLFQIKWEVYFSKNCVARLHCVVFIVSS